MERRTEREKKCKRGKERKEENNCIIGEKKHNTWALALLHIFFVPMGFSFSANVIPLINTAQKIVTQLTLINDHRCAALFSLWKADWMWVAIHNLKNKKNRKPDKPMAQPNVLMELFLNK